MQTDKRFAIQELHRMMVTRLFGGRSWPVDREACDALNGKLDELGLQEGVPGDETATRPTALGAELQVNLVSVFIGLWYVFEIPLILEDYGLIDEFDVSRIFDLLEMCSDHESAGSVLLPFVRKAYIEHYNPSGLLS